MKDFKVIEEYLMTYAGIHYKKPIDNADEMMRIKLMAKNARDNFIKLGNAVVSQFSDFSMGKCTNWISMNQVIPNYLWIQFKKDGFEKCPSSISLAVKKVKESFYLYVAVEIKDKEAEVEDFKRHNKILDMPLLNRELYYSGDNNEYFNIGKDSRYVKQILETKLIKKVRIQKNINETFNVTKEELINEITETIKILEPYYTSIILDFNDNNKIIKQNQVSRQNIESKINNSKKKFEGTNEWIITCNPSYYDVIGAFNELKKVEWKQSVNIKADDIVYIYVGNPFKEIKYKCIATKVDLNSAGRIDDSKFILDDSNYKNYGRYMELELLTKYEEQQYPLSEMKKQGLKSVQSPSRVTEVLSNYIKLIETNLYLEQNDNEDEVLVKDLKKITTTKFANFYKYKGKKKEKQNPKIQNGVRVYPRDKKVAMNALTHANYLCEIDEKHPTFMRKSIEVNYTEPHHLIPMAYSDLFDVSLDVEENIVSLCSNCHNLLHYGREFELVLKQLYNGRIEHLKKVGLYITFDKLLEMYL